MRRIFRKFSSHSASVTTASGSAIVSIDTVEKLVGAYGGRVVGCTPLHQALRALARLRSSLSPPRRLPSSSDSFSLPSFRLRRGPSPSSPLKGGTIENRWHLPRVVGVRRGCGPRARPDAPGGMNFVFPDWVDCVRKISQRIMHHRSCSEGRGSESRGEAATRRIAPCRRAARPSCAESTREPFRSALRQRGENRRCNKWAGSFLNRKR